MIAIPCRRPLARVLGLLLLLASGSPALALDQREAHQFNYYSTDAHAKRRIQVVEQYHWEPALECLRTKRYGCAQSELLFILTWVPNHPYALLKFSELTNRMQEPDKADSYFDAAMRYAPSDAMVRMLYGIHLHRSGRTDKAIERYEEAVDMDPNLSEAHYNLGLAYLGKGDLAKANEHAQKAYALGYPLPGLRDQLRQKKAWKPLPNSEQASSS